MKNYAEIIREYFERKGTTIEEELTSTMTEEEFIERVYFMTQYENNGTIDFKEFLQGMFAENYDIEDYYKYYNDYLEDNNYLDDMYYEMEFFDEDFMNATPLEIAEAVRDTDFNPSDNYYKYNGYGHLESFNDLSEVIDDDALEEWLIENSYKYGLDVIDECESDKDLLIEACLELVKNEF